MKHLTILVLCLLLGACVAPTRTVLHRTCPGELRLYCEVWGEEANCMCVSEFQLEELLGDFSDEGLF